MSTEKPHRIFWARRVTIRPSEHTRRSLRRMVGRLALEGGLKFEGQEATQEAIVNALWWAMEDMTSDPAGLERAVAWLEPYMRRIEMLPQQGGEDAREQDGPPERDRAGPGTRSGRSGRSPIRSPLDEEGSGTA